MKSYLAVLIFILAPFVYAQAQNGSDILASAIKNLPPCAVGKARFSDSLMITTDEKHE